LGKNKITVINPSDFDLRCLSQFLLDIHVFKLESPSGQTNDYKIGICCFSAKHVALRRKSKDWFARNQNNVSEWGDMSIRGLLFQWTSTIKIQLSMLV